MFKSMLTSGMLEDRTGVVEIVEFEAETIEKLLEFIYSGSEEIDMGLKIVLYTLAKPMSTIRPNNFFSGLYALHLVIYITTFLKLH